MPELLTVNEAAATSHVHQMTVRRHIKQGDLKAVRVGGRIRIRQEDLDEFVRPVTPWAEAFLASLKPPSPAEIERRRKLGAEVENVRSQMQPLGMTTAELIHEARREEEEQYDRQSPSGPRRLGRDEMASSR